MSKELIEKLSKLKMTEASLKRSLDSKSFSSKGKSKIFKELEGIKNEIELVKFKLKIEKEMKK